MAMDTIARGLAASVKKNLAENYYDKDQVDYLVDQIPKFSIEVVDELPTHDISETTIYMLRGEEAGQDIYQEWIYVNGNWESLGVQESAFDEYYKKTETYNQTEIDNLINSIPQKELKYVIGNSQSNPFIITENEPGIYAFWQTSPSSGFSQINYIQYDRDSNVRQVVFTGYLILIDNKKEDSYVYKPIGMINNIGKGVFLLGFTQPAPYGFDFSDTIGIGNYAVKTMDNQTINGIKTFNSLPKSSAIPTSDNDLVNKLYVDNSIDENTVQYSTMPVADSTNEGQIVQYTGSTTQTYTNGYFYKCVSDGGDPATYSWSQLNIQPAPDMSNYYTKAEVYNKEETDEMIDGIEELIGDVNTILATLTTLPSMSTIAERLEEVVDVTETPANNGGE